MTALEQKIPTTTMQVYTHTMQQLKMAKLQYMARKNIVTLHDRDFLEYVVMEASQ
ncbi:MAG: hypothetical protein HOD60_10220 [Candidatus Nitrosopelagicus sp.]|jgi:hypothetical protein|nr:hypothetical protein [Candidatus Nitrosopelagicus sp.]